MTALARVLGQASAVATLERALASQRVAQAYLFAGPSGVGKTLAARALAEAALCREAPGRGCGQCSTCTRIAQGTHPDVRIFAPRDEGHRNLQVEMLREEVLPFARFAPFEAPEAFVIFPEADVSFPEHHAEAANALLKTLEEPRPQLHFVLTSDRPERLLPTIRSRCQRVRFAALPPAALHTILERHGVAPEARGKLGALSGGRADRALALSEGDQSQRLLDWALRVDAAVGTGAAHDLLDLGEELARSEQRETELWTLELFYRDVAAAALGLDDSGLAFAERADTIRACAARIGARAAAERVALVGQFAEDLTRNANAEIAADALLFAMAAGRPPRAERPV
jgi:DNA polymerase-3 subunit delta'